MKSKRSLAIYIATSAGRNIHAYYWLSAILVDQGHTILDWFSRLVLPLSPDMPMAERREATRRDDFGEVFAFCSQAVASADLVIYLGPGEQDAACEVGMAYVAGVRTIGLRGLFEAPGYILHGAVQEWCDDPLALLHAVERLAEEDAESDVSVRTCRVCGCTDLRACPGGCSWVAQDLCSACAQKGAV